MVRDRDVVSFFYIFSHNFLRSVFPPMYVFNSVLVTFLLLAINTMTKALYKRKSLLRAYGPRGIRVYHGEAGITIDTWNRKLRDAS